MSKSTVRNTFPRLAVRWAVALAVMAALVAPPPPLFVGSPVSAQSSDDGDEIWSATMTVGNFAAGNTGYDGPPSGRGSLSDNDFTLGRRRFEINVILDSGVGGDRLHVGFGRALNAGEQRAMTLHIGGRSFAFEDAAYATHVTYDDLYSWPLSPRFGWAENDEVEVSITAVPIVTIEAVTSTVEYGGNNNAAESTAEFRFTRVGSTDDALSFEVSHTVPNSGQSSEVATKTFAAGQSSFSNFHWAVDVDRNNNTACSFIWTVRSGTGYVVGTPSQAQVNVSGPGTTCMSGM
ncbi:hypothetical protein [Candidatus Poriferisodalis sp.]|uniref:hypothetical protein n=1 Tax=Candidatus Poriferisodalis sp. TaxID=3101277 RepID=UPI003AF74FAB